MKTMLWITLFLTTIDFCLSEEIVDTCSKEESCGNIPDGEPTILKSILGLPGIDAEWGGVLENMKMFTMQIKTSLRELGLGQFVAELAEMAGLPGTKNDWMWMFTGITLETIGDGWNEFLFKLKDVGLSTILAVLKMPGSEKEWKASYQTFMDNFGDQRGIMGVVQTSLQFVGAPGSEEEWSNIVTKIGDNLVLLKEFFTED